MSAHRYFHDDPERRRWQDPEAVLTEMGLRTGSTFIDIGCGGGFFTMPAARIVGETGKVYAVDVNPEAIDVLKKKSTQEGFRNLVLKVGRAEDTVFCVACADIVFFGIVLHDFDDHMKVLLNAGKMLKATGRLVDLDWKKEPMRVGPPLMVRFSREEAVLHIEAAGFKIEEVKDSGLYHYLIFAKI